MIFLLSNGANRNIQDLRSDADAPLVFPVSGLNIPVQVAVVDRVANPQVQTSAGTPSPLIYIPEDMSAWDIQIALGNAETPPVAGTFTLTFGADTTSALQFNSTAGQVNTALNALASIISAGGVSVSLDGATFIVVFSDVGARTQITGDGAGLAPLSVVSCGTILDGSSAVEEVQTIQLLQNAATFVDLTSAAITPGAGATVTEVQVGGGGHNAIYTVLLTPQPYDGSWTISIGGQTSPLVSWNVTGADLQTAIEGMSTVGSGNVSVTQTGTSAWLIGFQGTKADTDMGTVTASHASLAVVRYLAGNLPLNVPGIDLLLTGKSSVDTSFQIIGTPAGGVAQQLFGPLNVTLVAGVITPDTTDPQPATSYYTSAQIDALLAQTKIFSTALTIGETVCAITFPVAFASTPSAVSCTISIPNDSSAVLQSAVDVSSITNTGFNLLPTVAIPASGYVAVTTARL